jgi:hypothetical protein
MESVSKLQKASFLISLCFLILLYGLFLTHKINLVTADLGRHLKNGELLLKSRQNLKLLTTNFYSYTEPEYPTINHHWGSGIIFFLIWKLAGFPGLSLFYLFLNLSTFLIFFSLAKKRAGSNLAVLASLLIIPLLAERTEIRPEGFSYFLAAVFFWLLLQLKEGQITPRRLLILPLVEIFWVNLHLYFFLGPLLIGTFLLEEFFAPHSQAKTRQYLAWILLLTLGVMVINPFGLAGAIAPLTIFKNYGYQLVENQPVWFIEKLIRNPNLLFFKATFITLVLSFILAFLNQRSLPLVNLCLGLTFSLMGWLAIRNFTLFGFFSLPILATNLKTAFKTKLESYQNLLSVFAPILTASIFILTILTNSPSSFPYWRNFGLGLEEGNNQPAEFFKAQKIQGPILNNYDIGSFLIFHLAPEQPVFVDNRPEAYSQDFFQKIYIPLQEDEDQWQKWDQYFGFNTIFFSYRDATPWGQKFLIERLNDPGWAPVFVDQSVLILLKRNELNQVIIEKYEIPKGRFRIISN